MYLRERLDLGADNIDSSLVRGIELHHPRLEEFGPARRVKEGQPSIPRSRMEGEDAFLPIELMAKGECSGSLARPGRSIEEQVRQLREKPAHAWIMKKN